MIAATGLFSFALRQASQAITIVYTRLSKSSTTQSRSFVAPRTFPKIAPQEAGADMVLAMPMFGEFGVYVDGKMTGSVSDDQLCVKPTASGSVRAEPASYVPPCPGAKPRMPIDADRWDNAEWHGGMLHVTAAELPMPRLRKPKRVT